MSVVGFDFGNESCIVAVARQRGIDVVLNDESKRETPTIVCFGEKQRFIGTAGAATSTMNPKNAISQIKRLIGRKFSDPELQIDLRSFPFAVFEGPDGFPLVRARYLGEQKAFTPTQILAMVLSNIKGIAAKNLNAAVVDCCIGIPVYFTDLQRRAVIDAATIAGLHPLRLLHETTATALAYGIYKTDLPENDQLNVAFIDVGHASMQVCIVGFKKGQLKILAHGYDRSLGGRDFDNVLFNYFAAKFKDEYKIDVYQNARACVRLYAACEKLKKMLSANPEAPLNIECLMDEKDVRGFIKRDEFEQISVNILERVKGPLVIALQEAGLTVDNIHSVEVVGSGSRVPAIIKILTEFFGKEPRRTLNASECVARGCALQCAILSPTFKFREFQMSKTPLLLKLVLGLCWWMIHLFLSIHEFASHLLQVIESFIISIGLLESYRHLRLDKLSCLAVVVDGKEAGNTLMIKKLLRWLSAFGVNYVILYDAEGVLKKSLDGDLSEFSNGGTSVLQKDRMIIELLSFTDNEGIAKAATVLCTKYLREQLASCDKKDPNITETEMFDALNAVGCGGPEPNLLLVYGPERCHLGFPAWRLRYTEIVHMGSLNSMKYGSILKALCQFSKKHQNYGT